MTDFLLDLSANPHTRKFIAGAGLPIPMPEPLARARGPWEERPLADARVVVGSPAGATLDRVLGNALVTAGASVLLVGDASHLAAYHDAGEAYGRPVTAWGVETDPAAIKTHALVFDATGLRTVDELRGVYDFFHPWIGTLQRNGRIVVLARPASEARGAEGQAVAQALDGFVRSVAKEVGKRGASANLLYVERGAEDRLAPVLRFVLSRRSAFVTGHPLVISAGIRAAKAVPATRPLTGKVALVTGAARGIGAATAELLAGEGALVVCLDRPDDDAELAKVARRIGGKSLLLDVRDVDAPQRLAAALLAEYGGVDIVVHNAGVTRDKTLLRMKPELWDQTLDINLRAVVRMTEALLDGVIRDGGRIVCLSSIAGIAGNMGQTNYAASKAGIIGYVRGLAPTVAKRGIAVNAIAPGFIETRLTAAIPVMIREAARRLSALGQGGLPEDVGQAITFLASPGAHGLSGQILRVCGGALVGA